MKEAESIPRKQGEAGALDFDSLRQEGIRLLQELSGDHWTDFNVHDPGVTLLEQLCFALTDLAYRSEFPVADYLAGEDGCIDSMRQALYRPEQVFPSHAVTRTDFRRLLFDQVRLEVPQLENLWILPLAEDAGRYRVRLKTGALDPQGMEQARAVVHTVFAAGRNLGEALAAVEFAERVPYRLTGRIETANRSEPSRLLGEIFFRCGQRISPGIGYLSYTDALEHRGDAESLLRGPLTSCGYIADSSLLDGAWSVSVADLAALIAESAGVAHVTGLTLLNAHGETVDSVGFDPARAVYPELEIVHERIGVDLQLFHNGRQQRVNADSVVLERNRLAAEISALRTSDQEFERLFPQPKGQPRDFLRYQSIRELFPAGYGVNALGIPGSADLRRKAESRQLKGYLALFDQVLADFQAQLAGLSNLYSSDPEVKRSYFYQVPGSALYEDADEVYEWSTGDQQKPADGGADGCLAGRLKDLCSRHDDFAARRNRFLDYLLALYGEKFSQASLRRFDCYHDGHEADLAIIANKLRFLTELPELGRNRMKAFDFSRGREDGANVSTLERKIALLLSMTDCPCGSPLQIYRQQGIQLSDAPRSAFDGRLRNAELPVAVLVDGVDPRNYSISPVRGNSRMRLVLKSPGAERGFFEKVYADQAQAEAAAQTMRRRFIELNRCAEGLYLVEHGLLKPDGGPATAPGMPDGEFFRYRISILFSGWTARTCDRGFRSLAEETVHLNCPAHLLAGVYWLDYQSMAEFEPLYQHWCDARRNALTGDGHADSEASALAGFLDSLEATAASSAEGDHGASD